MSFKAGKIYGEIDLKFVLNEGDKEDFRNSIQRCIDLHESAVIKHLEAVKENKALLKKLCENLKANRPKEGNKNG